MVAFAVVFTEFPQDTATICDLGRRTRMRSEGHSYQMRNAQLFTVTEQSEASFSGFLQESDPSIPEVQVNDQISPLLPCSSSSPSLAHSPHNHSSVATVPVPASIVSSSRSCGTVSHKASGVASSSQENRAKPCIITAFDLNYADRDELLRESSLLDDCQRHLLRLLETKRTEYSDGIPNAYFDNGYFIFGLANEKIAQRYVCCGRPQGTGEIPCKNWMFCERCANKQVHSSLARYANVFNHGTFFHLTVAFDGDLPFTGPKSTQILGYWEAINSAITAMCNSGTWRGAYWVDELHVRTFLPLRVMPHAHAIIDAERIHEDDLAELQRLIREYTGDEDNLVHVGLPLSIKLESLETERDLQNTIAYLTKATNLVRPYKVAWTDNVADDRTNAFHLNREVRELVEGVPELLKTIKGKKRKWWKGTMQPGTKNYIGTVFKKKRRKGKRTSRKR